MTKIVAMPPLSTCTHVQKMNIQYLLWEFAFFGLFYIERHTLVKDYVGVTFKNNLAKREFFYEHTNLNCTVAYALFNKYMHY